jgi:hypothetical protein
MSNKRNTHRQDEEVDGKVSAHDFRARKNAINRKFFDDSLLDDAEDFDPQLAEEVKYLLRK